MKERGGGGKGAAGVDLQTSPATAETQALQDFPLGFQRREDWTSALPESKFEFSVKRR